MRHTVKVRSVFWVGIFLSMEGVMLLDPFSLAAQQSVQKPSPPNIILIVADDLGYGDFSCYGATRIHTPMVDRLASEGIRYTDAYAASSLCSPSRYSILTGQYPWRTRWKDGVLPFFARPLIAKGTETLASLLKRNGYYTACVGKWHLGLDWALKDPAPQDPGKTVFNSWSIRSQDAIDFSKPIREGPLTRGFDYFFGIAGSLNMLPFVFIAGDHVVQAPRDSAETIHGYQEKDLEAPDWDPRTVNQVLTRKAVEVINQHFSSHDAHPLFLYFPTSAIHQSCLPTFTKGKSRAGLRGDMVEEFDWSVQQVVEALKKNKELSNSLIIITSDNGPRPGDPVREIQRYQQATSWQHTYYLDYFGSDTPRYKNPYGNKAWQAGWFTYGHKASGDLLGFKADAWEGGLRIPLIMVWPGKIKARQLSGEMICNTDLMATFSDLLGDTLVSSQGVDSYSFYNHLNHPEIHPARSSAVLTAGGTGVFVVREGAWAFIEPASAKWIGQQTYYPQGPGITAPQLYDLRDDISEQDNLYQKNPGKASDLRAIIQRVQQKGRSEGK